MPKLESELLSSTKNSDAIKQSGEIIAGKITDDEKKEPGGTTPTSEAASASALNDTGGRRESTGMSYKDTCSEISAVIGIGAPTFNKGDHKDCYKKYKEAGEKILKNCTLNGIQQQLHSAIELANKQSSFTRQAWIMRNAFEMILLGNIDTANFTESDKEELLKTIGTEMDYKEACHSISTAIDQGTPMFNAGDYRGCYDAYRQTAKKIVKHCSVAIVQQKLTSALSLAETQSSLFDRAWTMRHSFDAIIQHGISDDSIETDNDKGETVDSVASKEDIDKGEKGMSYEEACKEICAAISKGVPLYDEGDHELSFNTYKLAAEKILEEYTVEGIKRKLHSALKTVAEQAKQDPSSHI